MTRDEITAFQHLQLWSLYRPHWTDHNPSVTVTIREDEWFSVGAWVYENFENVGGVSFLPHSEHTYQQAPYTETDAAGFDELTGRMPRIVWGDLAAYETDDTTSGSQELACAAGACEIVDIAAK